jgi:hypothetical protein
MRIAIIALALAAASPAWAQSTIVLPQPGGVYVVVQPGQPNAYVIPTSGGGWTILQQGQPNTYVLPEPNGQNLPMPSLGEWQSEMYTGHTAGCQPGFCAGEDSQP